MARVRMVRIVNRSTQPLDCMFDGVPDVVPPGYRVVAGSVPKRKPNGEIVMRKVDGGGEEPVMVDGDVIEAAGADGEPLFHHVEYAAAEAYIRQHPVMGTSDPNSVDARDTEYLLGVIEWGDDISHREQSDALELIDRSLLPEEKRNIRVLGVGGARRQPAGPGVIRDRKIQANKRRSAMMGANMKDESPFGIKLSTP